MLHAYKPKRASQIEQKRSITRIDEPTLKSYIDNPLKLTFEDIIYLDSHNAGLRHVSSLAAGEQELNCGVIDGCSLNLCISESTILQRDSSRYLTTNEKQTLFQTLSLEEKEQIIQSFHSALHKFISQSIFYDQDYHNAVIKVGETTYEQFFKIFDDTIFNLIFYPESMLSLIDPEWAGSELGRFTKAHVAQEHILPIPLPSAYLLGVVLNLHDTINDEAECRNVIEQINNLFISIIVAHCRIQMQLENTASEEIGGLSRMKV